MALSAPRLTRKRVLQVKIETNKGELLGPDTDVLVFDLKMDPASEFIARRGSGKVLGNTSPGVLDGTGAGVCSFKVELRGTGSSGLDAGLAILLQACGIEKTLEVYTPTSVHATQKTISMACYEDGRRKRLIGAMGNFTMSSEEGRILLDCEFKGVWQAPDDTALPTVAYSTRAPLNWGTLANTFTLATESIKISTFSFSPGNEVVPRMDQGGIGYYMISDRDPTLTIDPESDLVAGYDLYGAWLLGSEVAVSLAITDGTDTVTLAGTKFQYREVAEGDRDGIDIDEVTGQFNIVTIDTGDDEFSLTVT